MSADRLTEAQRVRALTTKVVASVVIKERRHPDALKDRRDGSDLGPSGRRHPSPADDGRVRYYTIEGNETDRRKAHRVSIALSPLGSAEILLADINSWGESPSSCDTSTMLNLLARAVRLMMEELWR